MLERIDLWIVLAYMVLTLIVAFVVSSKSRDVEGYTVGNRRMSGIVIGFSVLGTFLSSITFLGVPAATYETNWSVFIFGAMLIPAALVAVLWIVPLYRSKERLSAYELLEERFGYWARLYACVSYLVLQLIRIGTVLLLVAFAVEPMLTFGVEGPAALGAAAGQGGALDVSKLVWILIVVGGLVIVYDTVGGISAVIWTDVLQVFVLAAGAIWCLLVLAESVGGFSEAFSQIPAEKFSLGPWTNWDAEGGGWNWGAETILVLVLYGLTENLRNYGADQNYVQRMFAAKSNRDANQSLWLGALTYAPLSIVFCLIGTFLMVYYSSGEHPLPAGLKPDQVFPHFIQTGLSKPVAGMVIAGILAAAMSTIDSCLNSCSTVVFVDVIRRLDWKPSGWPEIIVLRGVTILLGVLGTAFAVALLVIYGSDSRALMKIWWQYAGTAGGGLFGLFLLAWLMPRTPAWGAALGVLATIPVLAWGTFARKIADDSAWASFECPLHPNLVGIAGTLALLVVAGLALAVDRTLGRTKA